jgi:phosphatidylglycerol---prolipoprotein diacylglyceryl transferase
LAPLIPFITLPEIPLTPAIDLPQIGHVAALSVKPFGTLVAAGVYLGWKISIRQAGRMGMSQEVMSSFFIWVMTGGFVGGHVFDVLLYHPERVLEARSAIEALGELVFIWRSQSSFGGFMGAILGLMVWKWMYRVKDTLPWADTSGSTFPIGWVFGRAGCSIAHDHPGMRSEAWMAVQYPGGGRFDLGLCELLLTVPLAVAFLYLMRRPRPFGFYIGLMCMYYGPTRFALDFLRATDVRDADPRHLGLTPAQWLCSALVALGIGIFVRSARSAERGETPHYVGAPGGAAPATPTTPSAGADRGAGVTHA